jgi:hypothetical protein
MSEHGPVGEGSPGGERRSLVVPLSTFAGILILGGAWWALSPHGPQPEAVVFESATLGCRFEHAPELRAGPNFVRAGSGALLTIERHSLEMAKRDWVAALPDALFPQVEIQLGETYSDLVETNRGPIAVGGRKGLEVVLKGQTRTRGPLTVIRIWIFATEEWVYVVRSYSLEPDAAAEERLFRKVRETWTFLEAAQGAAPGAM